MQDSISGLTDTSDVIIQIVDTNQPPVCENPGPVMINSNLAPSSVITKIICNDYDITETYKNLSYSISTGNEQIFISNSAMTSETFSGFEFLKKLKTDTVALICSEKEIKDSFFHTLSMI